MINYFNLLIGIVLLLIGAIVLYDTLYDISKNKIDKYGADVKGIIGGGSLFLIGIIMIFKALA